MATSSKTGKAGDSDRKATSSGRKASGSSGRKTAGSQRKTSGSSGRQSSTGASRQPGSASRKSSTGSGRKSSTGSGQKSSGSSGRKTAGSQRKASTSSAQKSGGSGRQAADSKQQTGIYVYGILPADVEMASDTHGVGYPPGQIRVVRSDGLAALVSEVDLSRELGSPEDLQAHKEILDASAAELPVLPLRFGAVLTDEEAVVEELLADNHDEFTEALSELDGRVQYVVKGRYAEDAILEEVLSESKQAARLRDKIRDADPDATRNARIKLGEIINSAVTAKRHKDTRALGDAMEGICVASVVREPTHELDAVHLAFLVESAKEEEFGQVIEDLASEWEGRIELRSQGPMAAYDFVGSALPEG
jgi:Gas vesicle synthesis protein GvpL/GvpF